MLEENSKVNESFESEKVKMLEKLTRWSGNKARLDDMLLISFKP